MSGREWTHLFNKKACHYLTMSGTCRRYGKACPKWTQGEDCSCYIYHADTVRTKCVEPKLRKLLQEAAASTKMVFVENNDYRYTREDLNRMMDCVVHRFPILCKYVDIDASRQGDYLIAIYQGVGAILAND